MVVNKFLQAEERNGYVVDEKMKKVWLIELQILEKFVEVCKKYELKYFLSGGTLLGAVRHKGFIPWDDDIDIDMMRADYEKLIEVAPNEFTGQFFFQTTFSDDNYYRPHAQIRNSNTTAILSHEQGLSFNQGIFIDIFPLDAPPDNQFFRFIHSKIAFFMNGFGYAGIMINANKNKNIYKIIAHYIAKPFFLLCNYRTYYKLYEKLITFFNNKNSTYVGEISLIYTERFIYKKEWFQRSVDLDFEYLKLACPVGYKEILRKAYGDYMKPIKGTSFHGNIYFDTEHSYKKYI